MSKHYPNCVVHPDNEGQWILYVDNSCQEVIAFFPDKEDAEVAQEFFLKGDKGNVNEGT